MKDSNQEDKNENTHQDINQDSNEKMNDAPIDRQWRSDRHYKSNKMKVKTGLITVGLTFLFALIAYTIILYGGKLIVDEEDLILSSPTTIESADGDVIWEIHDEYRLPISLDEMPEELKDAFVAIEDRRFYEHTGVDFRAIMRAVYKDVLARSKVEGASTITQQLAKNMFLSNDKTWLRKTKEVMVALYLEREFTKDEILEMYINVIYFGRGKYGVEAISQEFYQKPASELTLSESALLAGIVNAPNGYSPIEHPEKAKERRNLVLKVMYESDKITETEMKEATQTDINIQLAEKESNKPNQSYVDQALKEAHNKHGLSMDELKKGGYQLITPLKEEFQEIAYDNFQEGEYFPGNTEGTEGAFVMMDQQTGGIVAALGGRQFEIAEQNLLNTKRQPGSTLKPLAVFGPALMTGDYDPYTMLPDEKKDWSGWTPKNYDDNYEGNVSLYEAIVKSKNVTSVWLLNEIGVKKSKSYLKKMNMNIPDKELNIALGGLTEGLTPINLAEGYRTFAANGEFIESFTIAEIYGRDNEEIFKINQKPIEVFSEQVAWDMTEILQTTVKRGTASSGYYPKALAGKTGTTENEQAPGNANKDAWFVGYTPEYVTSMWMGYDKSDADHYLTGGSAYPTQLTKKILTEINSVSELKGEFAKSENVTSLETPIELPKEVKLTGKRVFGGFQLIKGKLSWDKSEDKRIVYRIYEELNNENKLIAEVADEFEYIVDDLTLFSKRTFHIVPYDPLTGTEGNKSNSVSLSK